MACGVAEMLAWRTPSSRGYLVPCRWLMATYHLPHHLPLPPATRWVRRRIQPLLPVKANDNQCLLCGVMLWQCVCIRGNGENRML